MALHLTLASNSPRRRALLALTGWPFIVRAVEVDESPRPGEPPADYVLRLAESKARAAGKGAGPEEIILTADTTVADGSSILGKPAGTDEARAMLRQLRGREHAVHTAIGIFQPQGGTASDTRILTDLCTTRVWMRAYSDAEIEAYVASGDPLDKAGAYAIQNLGFSPVERIEGCYACVVGLPICRVVRALELFGLMPQNDITAACSEAPGQTTPCRVHQAIIAENGRQ